MSAENDRDLRDERKRRLQEHLCDRASKLDLPESPKELLRELQGLLHRASDDRLLQTKHHDVFSLLKRSGAPKPHADDPAYIAIVGGEKDLKRTGTKPRFVRRDAAWFTFTITVYVQPGRPLRLCAYDFELCFPSNEDHDRGPRFVRFDLNLPEHANDARGHRCHVHPGHDDLTAPAPLMTPIELLDLFVHDDLALPENARLA